MIFRLEQGEEPWILEEEFPRQSFPGELMCTEQMNIREFISPEVDNFKMFFEEYHIRESNPYK